MGIVEKIVQSDNIAAVILLRKDGAALLQLRDNIPDIREAGKWTAPGGGIEPEETAESAAKRELFEETEYLCDKLNWLTSFEHKLEGWPSYELSVFWCIYDGKQSVKCHEGQDLRFIERRNAHKFDISNQFLFLWDQALIKAKIFVIN